MSKAIVTRLFIAAILAVVVGLVIELVAVIAAFAGGTITIGGPTLIDINRAALAGTLIWLVVGIVTVAVGAVAAIASWIGALVNTFGLEDKAWFVALLVLGLVSFGWVAMAAYVVAGPDSTNPGLARPGLATTPSA